jgi:hypothetical protein
MEGMGEENGREGVSRRSTSAQLGLGDVPGIASWNDGRMD